MMNKTNKLLIQWLSWPIHVRIALIVILLIFFFGELISVIEPKEFPTAFDGIWWAIVTVSTVGFGDSTPKTHAGKLVGMVTILIGASFAASYFAILSAATFQKQQAYVDGEIPFKRKDHVVIIGWNEKAHEMIQSLRAVKPFKQIVLIDHSLKEAPLMENVHFVRGNPTNDFTLQKANVKEADAAIITADQHKNELDADMQSVLVLLALKGNNPSLYCVIEILTEHQANNATRAGADEIIKTYQLTSHFIMSSYLAKNGLSSIYSKLNPATGNSFQILPVPNNLVGKTFKEASIHLLDQETILLGIKREEEAKMNPPLSYEILANDYIIVFSH